MLKLSLLALSLLGPSALLTAHMPGHGDADEGGLPVSFAEGADYGDAQRMGIASALEFTARGDAYRVGLAGPSGGRVVVDELVIARARASVESYTVELVQPLAGDLRPTEFRLRLWTGPQPPRADSDAGVCAVLDLLAPGPGPAQGACDATASAQFVLALPHDAAGTARATLRPTRIVLGHGP